MDQNPFADLIPNQQSSGANSNPFADLIPQGWVTEIAKGGTPLTIPPQIQNQAPLQWAGVAGQAATNLIPSAKQFGSDIYTAVSNPKETATNLMRLGAGGVEKLIPGQQGHEKYADAFGQFVANRYGSWDAFKNTLATDPVGAMADLSVILTGPELALVRGAGTVGKVGRIAGAASRAVDPIGLATKGVGMVGKGVAEKVVAPMIGITTGTGSKPIVTAARSGFAGGEAGQAFRENMRGQVPMENIVAEAKGGVLGARRERGSFYNAGMSGIKTDKTILDFSKVDDALNNTRSIKTFKGISLSPSTDATVKDLALAVDEWRKGNPSEFHTAEGFDALKQKIGDIRDSTPYGTPSRLVADQIYNVVKQQIVKQAPQYARVMKNYETASTLISDMERTLSLSSKATVDTALRKLQSVMRDNVNTNYGARAKLAEQLSKWAPHLQEKLAGQALGSVIPRGLAKYIGMGELASLVPTLIMNPLLGAKLLSLFAISSPRLVGEVAHAGGRAARQVNRLPARIARETGYAVRNRETANPSQ